MELRNKQTGEIIFSWDFPNKFPDTSFPEVIDEQTYNAFGFDVVFEGPQAIFDNVYQFSQRAGVEQINGKWFTKYVKGPVFVSNDVASAEEQEAQFKASMDASRALTMRSLRTQKLADSDWTQVPDAPVDRVAWRAYRQELRDITKQEGFPWNVTWPVEP